MLVSSANKALEERWQIAAFQLSVTTAANVRSLSAKAGRPMPRTSSTRPLTVPVQVPDAAALRLRCTLITAIRAAGVAWYSSSDSSSSGVTGVVATSR